MNDSAPHLISLVTYCDLPDLDPDDQLIAKSLAAQGFNSQAVVWNDDSIDWENAGVCIVRSTWDYHKHYEQFLAWIDLVAARKVSNEKRKNVALFNSARLMRWNSNKKYLLELNAKGISTTPTLFFSKNSQVDLAQCISSSMWPTVIVKPAIGLATAGVKKFEKQDLAAGQQHLDNLLTTGDALIQPYLQSIETSGEKSLVFIDGEFSHCIRKAPFQSLAVAGQAGETLIEASPNEISFGENILSKLDEETLYARVDIVNENNVKIKENAGSDQLLLLELELIEPSLFLAMHEPAAANMARAIIARAIS